MRLFFIFPLFGPKNGVTVISNHIKSYLSDNYNNIDLIAVNTAQAESHSNFGRFSFNKMLFFFSIIKALIKIRKEDLVYLNITPKGFAYYRDFLIMLFCLSKTKKVTIHIHANGLEKKINKLNFWLYRKVNIIVINSLQKERLKAFKGKVFLINNALPDYYVDKNYTSSIEGIPNLIFLSNLSKRKGLNRLVALAKIISKEKIVCQINVYGGILKESDRKSVNELGKKYSFINYLGVISDSTLKYEALQKNDILLFLSDVNYEVYPLVYIEALMCGLGIITTPQVVSEILTKRNVAKEINSDLSNFESLLLSYVREGIGFKYRARATFSELYTFPKYIESIMKVITNNGE